jgi:hypothetical protein
MGWFILAQLFFILIALVSLGRLSERAKVLQSFCYDSKYPSCCAIAIRQFGQPQLRS